MLCQKVLKCRIVGLTKTKEHLINREYDNLQLYLQGIYWLDNLYSANKQQADRFYKTIHPDREYPISMRKDLIQIEHRDTKIAKYWARIRVKGCKNLWVAIKPHTNIPEDIIFSESKLIKKPNGFWIHLTIEKEVKIKTEYDDILSIDLGVRRIASVVQLSNGKPKYYGRELRQIRGHHFYLRKKLAKKKIRQFYKYISNSREKNQINDQLHKIARHIVEQAQETNSAIVIGKLKGVRKHSNGRKFNRKIATMSSFKLTNYIRYKANWLGIEVVEVEEAYTSQTCHRCGAKGIRNRGLFRCENCGLEDNSDRNGALNIGKRGLGSMLKLGAVVNLPRTEAVNMRTINRKVSDNQYATSEATQLVGW